MALLPWISFLAQPPHAIGAPTAGGSPQTAPVVLRAASLCDPRSGEVVSNAVVVVKGNRIETVGAGDAIPPDARIIDLGHLMLLPGLIDSHTHLLMNLDSGQADMWLNVSTMSTARRALLGAAMGRQALEAGITTVRDLGNSGWNGDVALRDAIAAGWVVGPRLFAATRALSGPGGQFGPLPPEAQSLIAQEYATINGVEDARRAVRQALHDGADLIKVIVNAGSTYALSREELEAIVEEAHRVGKRVAAHATTDIATRIAADAGVDSIEHGYSIPDDALRMMAKKGIYLVPTDYPVEFYTEVSTAPGPLTAEEQQRRLESVRQLVLRSQERLRRAVKLGVRIAYGSDAYYALPGRTRGGVSLLALQAYQEAGLSPLEVLRTATINAADLLGWGDRLGTIEAGKLADLIAVEGEPLKDIKDLQRVRFVMKGGRVIRDDRHAAGM